jgi:hypothetical protein
MILWRKGQNILMKGVYNNFMKNKKNQNSNIIILY